MAIYNIELNDTDGVRITFSDVIDPGQYEEYLQDNDAEVWTAVEDKVKAELLNSGEITQDIIDQKFTQLNAIKPEEYSIHSQMVQAGKHALVQIAEEYDLTPPNIFTTPAASEKTEPANNSEQNDIADIQMLLTQAGYDAGAIDGISGPSTMAAVNAFQNDHIPQNKDAQTTITEFNTETIFDFKQRIQDVIDQMRQLENDQTLTVQEDTVPDTAPPSNTDASAPNSDAPTQTATPHNWDADTIMDMQATLLVVNNIDLIDKGIVMNGSDADGQLMNHIRTFTGLGPDAAPDELKAAFEEQIQQESTATILRDNAQATDYFGADVTARVTALIGDATPAAPTINQTSPTAETAAPIAETAPTQAETTAATAKEEIAAKPATNQPAQSGTDSIKTATAEETASKRHPDALEYEDNLGHKHWINPGETLTIINKFDTTGKLLGPDHHSHETGKLPSNLGDHVSERKKGILSAFFNKRPEGHITTVEHKNGKLVINSIVGEPTRVDKDKDHDHKNDNNAHNNDNAAQSAISSAAEFAQDVIKAPGS